MTTEKFMTVTKARSRLKTVSEEVEKMRNTVKVGQKKLAALESEERDLIKFLNTPSDHIGVSDHALIRYLERKYGFNFEDYRAEILTPERVAMIKAGVKTISVDGVKLKIENNVVVTVI
jgi:hypothetical protein